MPVDPRDYLLKFDLADADRQFSSLKRSYTDFGTTVRSMSAGMMDDMRLFHEKVDSIIASVSLLHTSMSGISSILSKMVESSDKLAKNLGSLASADVSAVSTPSSRVADILPGTAAGLAGGSEAGGMREIKGLAEEAQKQAADALKASKDALAKVSEASEKTKEEVNWLMGHVKKEMKGIQSSIMRGASMFTPSGIGAGGTIAALLIGTMVLGYKEKTRKAAEAGEMQNVFAGMGEAYFKKASQTATKWWSDFAQKIQFEGITRKEIQGLVKMFVDAGDKGDELMTKYDKRLGKVGANLGMATLGLDKLFNKATGTSAKGAIDIMTLYGDSAYDAVDKTVKIGMAAQSSGMNMERFTNSIMSGSQSLAQYGIDVKDVLHVMQTLKKHYEDMGLDKMFSGEQAATAVAGITSGLASLSPALQAILGERMSPGKTGLEARQSFMEGYKRTLSGEDQGWMIRAAKELLKFAMEQTSGRREDVIWWLQKNVKNDPLAMTSFYDIGPALNEANKLSDLNNSEIKALRKTLGMEKETVNKTELMQRDLINAVSTIGQGLIQVISGLMGAIVVGYKSLPILFGALMGRYGKDTNKVLDNLQTTVDLQFKEIGKGFDTMAKAEGPLMEFWEKAVGKDSPLGKALDLKIQTPEIDIPKALKNKLEETSNELLGKDATVALKDTAEDYGNLFSKIGDALVPEGGKLSKAIDATSNQFTKAGQTMMGKPQEEVVVKRGFVLSGADIKESLRVTDSNINSDPSGTK